MLTLETRGNIVEATTDAIVNTVNCVGVMGKGIALQFRQAFPENYELYRRACKQKQVKPGTMLVYRTGKLTPPRFIINFPTKRHWRGKARLEDIQSGLVSLVEVIKQHDIKAISIPALGCGNGGLKWDSVRPLIEAALTKVPGLDSHLYTPHGAPAPSAQPVQTKKPRLTDTRAALILLLQRYQIEGYKHTLLEVQKLAYFLQVAGQPLKLSFVRDKFGPYAEKLNFVLQALEGHYIRGYGDRSRAPEIVLLNGATSEAEGFLRDESAIKCLSMVSELIEGFETPYGLELLSTVHWVMADSAMAGADLSIAISAVQSWNKRKRELLKPAHIALAWERLRSEGWAERQVASAL